MSTFRRYFVVMALSLGYAASFMLPYIKYVFYDQLLVGINCTNEQAGLLLTIYTIMNLCLYIPGGWVADKYSAKWVIVLSLAGTGILNIFFATYMTFSMAMIVWVLLAFTTAFAFWSGVIKAIRLLGSAREQGRLYGFFNAGVGLFSAGVSAVGMFVYGLFVADQVAGLKGVIYVQGAACLLSATVVMFFYSENKNVAEESEDDKFQTKDLLTVLKEPMTWVISLLIFCGHGIYTSTSYFNPYMTNVIGVTMAFSGVLAIVRTHILRVICGPVGGVLADRVKSPSLVLIYCFAAMTALLAIFIFIPAGTSAVVVIGLQLLLAAVTFTAYAILYSCIEEAGIPRKLTGTTVAMASMLGYLPDMIYNPLFGRWLDQYQNTGYIYIFLFLAVSGLVGMGMAFLVRRRGNARRFTESAG
ncbi:MFS transporter [Desulfovibrio piger]|uniref:MFS transporter n=1 Tax=Desulfovibrio piger TaxID=901 RepID=UPI0026EA1B0C|nr:MFS transporter [Desulfovibrio piger]